MRHLVPPSPPLPQLHTPLEQLMCTICAAMSTLYSTHIKGVPMVEETSATTGVRVSSGPVDSSRQTVTTPSPSSTGY